MRHMTEKDRFYIEKALKKKMSVREIAADLGFSRQAIYAEIKRGKTEQIVNNMWERKVVYLADAGQRKHDDAWRRTGRKEKLAPDDVYLKKVSRLILEEKYSPEAAFYRIGEKAVCIKTLYNYAHKGYILGVAVINLPYAKEKHRKKSKVVKRAFSRGKSIDQRAADIDSRGDYGHWEMDTVYSSRDDLSCLLVLSERKEREEIIIKMKDRTCSSVLNALNRLERSMGAPAFRQKFKTITADNGMEFADWQSIEQSSLNKVKRTTVYFCHPFCSGERGTNENINRMIRRWIPKGDDIGLYSVAEIRKIQDWINNYPRRMFGGLSSYEHQQLFHT